jgi:hypothetical protein
MNWRQEYLHLSTALMTACWLAPWLALSLNWFVDISLAKTVGLSAVHLLASMWFIRWGLHRRMDSQIIRLITLLLMLVAALLTLLLAPSLLHAYGGEQQLGLADLFYFDRQERVPAGPILIVWVLILWWRGYQMGSVYLSLVRASFGMRLGIFSFLWITLFASSTLRDEMLALIPFFFFFGLTSSSLARADSLNLDRSGRASPFGRGWIVSLMVIGLLVTAGGYLFSLWVAGMDLSRAAQALTTLGEGLMTILFLILSPLLLLLQLIYNALQALMPDKKSGQIIDTRGERGGSTDGYAPWITDLFSLIGDALLVLVISSLVMLVLALLWFLFIARGERKEYEDEERETLGTGEVVGGLRQAFRDRWRRLSDALGLLREFGLGRSFFTALTIRRIYGQMQRLAGQRGYPRTPSETPYEYRRNLIQAFPGMSDEIQRITEAYIAVRYGDVPENDAELRVVREAWERLQASPAPT